MACLHLVVFKCNYITTLTTNRSATNRFFFSPEKNNYRKMEILYFLYGAAFAGQRQSGRTSCLANHVRVMAFRQSLPLLRNGKLKKSLAGYMAFGGTGDRPAHRAFLCVAGMEVFGDCRERSHHVREQLKSKR